MTATRLLKAATLVFLAAGWVAAAGLLWRTKVPDDLSLPHVDSAAFFSASERNRAEHFESISSLLYLLRIGVELAILAMLALRGRRLARGFALGEIGAGVMIAVAANLFIWLAGLPLGLLGHWWDRRYGISKRDYTSYIGQQALGLLVQTAVVAIVLAVIMAIARALPRHWWLVTAPLFLGVAIVLIVVLALLAPLGTTDIRDPQVAATAEQLQEREGVPGTEIRVDDVDDKTTAVNAQMVGLGPTNVVILWNTLFRSLSDGAVEFVIAHELGHAARRHIPKGIGWSLLFSLPLTFLLAAATRRRGGMHRAEVVPYALLVSAILGLLAAPLQNIVSRRYEAEADWMALQATRDPGAGREAFRSFTRIDLADPNPPLWSYVMLETHPTVMQRLAMTKAWEARGSGLRGARRSRAGS
jgi:STE24 endopeptidase